MSAPCRTRPSWRGPGRPTRARPARLAVRVRVRADPGGRGRQSEPCRRQRRATWHRLVAAPSPLGSLLFGWLMEHFERKSVLLVTVPLAVLALILAVVLVPGHVNETTDPMDNIRGILSVVLVAALVAGDQRVGRPRVRRPRYRPRPAGADRRRRIRTPAAKSRVPVVRSAHRRPTDLLGRRLRRIIVFGTLTAAMFVGQQFLIAGSPASHSVLADAALVFFCFPRREREQEWARRQCGRGWRRRGGGAGTLGGHRSKARPDPSGVSPGVHVQCAPNVRNSPRPNGVSFNAVQLRNPGSS